MTTNDSRRLLDVPAAKAAYSLEEVAQLLGLHRTTVSGFVSRGELRAARLGHRTVRITHDALMDFLKSKEAPPMREKKRARGGKKS